MHDLRRRALVGFSAALCFAPAFLSRAFASALTTPVLSGKDDGVLRCIAEVFRDLEGVREIGKRWLEMNSGKSTHSQVLAELMSEPMPQDPVDFRRYIVDRRELDLRNDDIVIVDGWILARTEARLCARAFLLSHCGGGGKSKSAASAERVSCGNAAM